MQPVARRLGSGDFIKIFASNSVRAGGAPLYSAEQLAALCSEAKRLGLRSVVHAHSDASIRTAALAGCDQVEHGFLATYEGLSFLAVLGAVLGQGFTPLDISTIHAQRAGSLPGHHQDPWDCMLIAQAQAAGLAFVSNETLFDQYGISRIW